MSGHPQCRLEAPSSSERVDISQRPPPSPHNHPRLLGSWSSPGFLITGQRKHLAFLSWSAESGGGFLLPWAPSPAHDCPPPVCVRTHAHCVFTCTSACTHPPSVCRSWLSSVEGCSLEEGPHPEPKGPPSVTLWVDLSTPSRLDSRLEEPGWEGWTLSQEVVCTSSPETHQGPIT